MNKLVWNAFCHHEFVDTSKKRKRKGVKSQVQKKMENMIENVFKFLNDEDLERIGDYCW